jgi:hypothetical protein
MSRNKSKHDNRAQDENINYPGYPHYSSEEDITNPENNNGKIPVNEEYINLPDVRDIPGQGDIVPPPLEGIGDTTISSADEEDLVSGDSLDNLTGDDDEVKIVMGTEADVTAEDLQLLGAMDGDMDLNEDEDTGQKQWLDDTDSDGEPLNETSGKGIASTGEDLDVPGSEADDANENIGEEDEENNYYSLGKNDDNSTEGTP